MQHQIAQRRQQKGGSINFGIKQITAQKGL